MNLNLLIVMFIIILGELKITFSSSPEEENVPVANSPWDCAICKSTAKNPRVLKCGHMFCKACIKNWLKSRQEGSPPSVPSNKKCPMCRLEIIVRYVTYILLQNLFI